MSHEVLRNLCSDIRSSKYFSLICDEYTDVSNKEQMALMLCWVDKDFTAHEDFVSFYELKNTKCESIYDAIQYILVRLQLSLDDCRVQCYDGASNMMGKNSGVAKKVQAIQSKAFTTHCHFHFLSLGVQESIRNGRF